MRRYLWQVRPYDEFHLFCLFFAYCFAYCLPRQISEKTRKSDLASKLCKYSDPSQSHISQVTTQITQVVGSPLRALRSYKNKEA